MEQTTIDGDSVPVTQVTPAAPAQHEVQSLFTASQTLRGQINLETDPEEKPVLECIEGPDGCYGRIAHRMPLSGTGQATVRCDGHWQDRLDLEAELATRYPSSRGDCFDGGYPGGW